MWNKLELHWKIIIGLVIGVIWALLSSFLGWSQYTLNWIAPWGEIFINLLKLIAVPLVLFSIIKGITGLDNIKSLGEMGIKTLVIYILTTIIAVSIGLGLVNSIKPGTFLSEEQRIINRLSFELWARDNIDGEIPDDKNFLAKEEYRHYLSEAQQDIEKERGNTKVAEKVQSAKKKKQDGPLQFLVDMVPSNIFLSLNNNSLMLQIIFFAIFFGITCLFLPKPQIAPVLHLVDGMNEVFLKMVDIVMQAAPFFVFALLAGKLSELAGDNPQGVIEIFKGLGWYSLVVVLGLAIMVFVVYPIIVISIGKYPSYKNFFKSISSAQMLAFSTSSSAATLPVTMECVHENLKVPKQITGFVLPIGATINMDGTSLYQAVAVVFLAQFHFVDLTVIQQLTIIVTATLASIGSAAVPSAGLIMLIIVLESVGLNPAWIAIIFPVDRILDMCRTVVNVTGDAAVSTVIARSVKIEQVNTNT